MAFVREDFDVEGLLTKRATAKLKQQQERQFVGQRMTELENEPLWRTYVQHLNALKEPYSARVVVLEKMLFNSTYLSPDDFSKLRYELAKDKATAETFKIAQDLVLRLIEQGKVVE